MTIKYSTLLAQFEDFTVDPARFGHLQHIQVAFEILHKYDYVDACTKYATAIDTIATNAGAPEKFNVTITLAFLSLIAERIDATKPSTFEEFLAQHEDLLHKGVLDQWYSREQLESEFARTHFLLPRRAA